MGTDGGVHRDTAEGEAKETLSARNRVRSPVKRRRYAGGAFQNGLSTTSSAISRTALMITKPT